MLLTAGLVVVMVCFSLSQPVRWVHSTDDGFFYLAIATNVAAGHGLTADGVSWTNGFQPLWAAMVAALAWVAKGDEPLLLRLVLVLSTTLQVATGVLLACTIRRQLAGPISGWMAKPSTAEPFTGRPAAPIMPAAAPTISPASTTRQPPESSARQWSSPAGQGGDQPDQRSRDRWSFARDGAWWAALLSYLLAWRLFELHHNFLETGCALCLFAAVLLTMTNRPYTLDRSAVSHRSHQPWRDDLQLSLLLGLLVLARIDALLLVVLVGTVRAMTALRTGHAASLRGVWRAVAIGSVPLLLAMCISSPWWIYNITGFGQWVPSSGQAMALPLWQDSQPAGRLLQMVAAVSIALLPHIHGLTDLPGGLAIRLGLLALVGMGWALWTVRRVARSATRRWSSVGGWLRKTMSYVCTPLGVCTTYAALLVLAYLLMSEATWFYPRYIAPLNLLATMAVAYALAWLARSACGGPDRWLIGRLAVACMAGGIGLMVTHAGLQALRHPIVQDRGFEGMMPQVRLVKAHVPAGEVVAADQTGTLMYMLRDSHRVLNLDGKVNTEAIAVRRRREGATYLANRQVRWFCDMDYAVRLHLGEHPPSIGWQLVAQEGAFSLYHRAP